MTFTHLVFVCAHGGNAEPAARAGVTVRSGSSRDLAQLLDAGKGRVARSESLFALSNATSGFDGNLDESEPYGIPGSYLNSVCEVRSLPYPEPAYGDPEVGQTVVNVTNGKLIRLLVDDEPFGVCYGRLLEHERLLDLRAGTLTRHTVWESRIDRGGTGSAARHCLDQSIGVRCAAGRGEPLSHVPDDLRRRLLSRGRESSESCEASSSDPVRRSCPEVHGTEARCGC